MIKPYKSFNFLIEHSAISAKISLVLFLLFFQTSGFSQIIGGFPNRIKWNQIENDTVQVVFPAGMDYWGQRVANIAAFMASKNDSSLVTPPFKTTIFVRNLTTIPNGFVAIAPYRAGFFSTPAYNQFNGLSSWIDLLSIHEYRHVLQYSKVMVKRKWSPEHILFGQGGWAVISFIVLPNWYWEGDAVKTETLYTHSGRGRVPGFYLQFPALRAMGNKYNFEKTRAGSFKDYVPNHYALGYHLTSYLQMNFGEPIWDQVVTNSVRRYALISHSIKKSTGLKTRSLYAKSMTRIDSIIGTNFIFSDKAVLSYQPRDYTEYELIKASDNKNLIYVKTSFKNIPAYYFFDGKKEKKLFEPGFRTNEHWFDLKNNRLVWAELYPDVYWGNENFSAIKIYNLSTGKATYLASKKTKWFYPKWAENGTAIAVLESKENGTQNALLVDTTGRVLNRIEIEQGAFVSSIVKANNNGILVVYNKDEKTWFTQLDFDGSEPHQIGPVFYAPLRHPVVFNNAIYFSTVVGHTEQIVRLNLLQNTSEIMSDVPFRAIDPLVVEDTLYYVSYEGIGYSIRKKTNKKVGDYTPVYPKMAFYTSLEKGFPSQVNKISHTEYKVKSYKKSSGLINIHSWFPWVFGPNFGLTLFLENKLATFQSTLTYVYNSNEKASQFVGEIIYAQLYPSFFVGASHTLNRNANNGIIESNANFFNSRSWSETDFYGGITLPFYLMRGKWSRFLSFRTSTHYLIANLNEASPTLSKISFPYYQNRVQFYNLLRTSHRQIFPRWGQNLVIEQQQSFDNNIAEQYTFLGTFYFPGIIQTHSLSVRPAYKYEPLGKQYYFLDSYPSTYGYNRPFGENSLGLLFRYTLPLWYPDKSIPGFVFFKRIYSTAFYNYSKYYDAINTSGQLVNTILQRSTGLELNFDLVLFRIVPFRIGVRASYRFDPEPEASRVKFDLIIYAITF